MANKKSKRSSSSKKSAESTKVTRVSKAEEKPAAVDEVVSVVEVDEKPNAKKGGKTLTDKLVALNPATLIAELVGTFVLSAAVIRNAGGSNLISVALILAILVVVFSAISGSHFNPAITIAQWVNRRIDGVKAISYIVAQVLGAVLAFFVVTGVNNANYDYSAAVEKAAIAQGVTQSEIDKEGGIDKWAESWAKSSAGSGDIKTLGQALGVTDKAPDPYKVTKLTEGKEWVALISEVIGAIVFGVGVAYATLKKNNALASGLAVGIGFLAGALIAGTTAILNPAVAAAIGAYGWGSASAFLWPIVVYVLGTSIGMTLGYSVYSALSKSAESSEKE